MPGVEELEEGNDDTEEDEDEGALTAAVAVATAAALALAVAAATASGTAGLDCCTIVAGLGVAESSELYPTKASIVAFSNLLSVKEGEGKAPLLLST